MSHITIKVLDSLEQIDKKEYTLLKENCGGSIFYDYNFLMATEKSPLLPIEKTYYIAAYKNSSLVAFMPSYLQSAADPFGILAKTTLRVFDQQAAFFSHIMHCYESMILALDSSRELYQLLLEQLKILADKHDVKFYGILNVVDQNLSDVSRQIGYDVNYMWDRFYIDFSETNNFEHFLAKLNREGRQSYNRHLRKFEDAQGRVEVETVSEINILEVAELCYLTTKKHGTAHYYPPEAFSKFIATCGDIVRILSVHVKDRRVAVGVCFLEKGIMHLWACGMVYDDVPFSPYIIAIAGAFKYALQNNIQRVEIGRTNGKMKEKLGFSPLPLYSIVNNKTGLNNE